MPAQPVGATPSNALIRQCFPGRSDLFGCTRSKPSQGSVPADLTLATDLAFVFNASRVRPECCVDPLRPPRLPGIGSVSWWEALLPAVIWRSMPLSEKRENWCLFVQDNPQEGIVDVDLAVVLDKAQSPEFVHEKIDAGPRCANHLGQHLLRYFGKHLLRLASRAIAREQQQSARQPFLAGVEELVDQVLLDSHVSRKHISDETVGELVFLVERANHLIFLNDEHGGWRNRGRGRHANGLARKASFPKKIARSKDSHNGFFARLIGHSELHTAFLNVHDILRGIALREDGLFSSKLFYISPQTGRIEKSLGIESMLFLELYFGFGLA